MLRVGIAAILICIAGKSFAQDPRQFPTHRTQVAAFVDLLMEVQISDGIPVHNKEWAMVVQLISEDFLTQDVWKDLYLRHYAYSLVAQTGEAQLELEPRAKWYEERLGLVHRFSLHPKEVLAFIPADRHSAEVQKSFRALMKLNFKNLAWKETIFRTYYMPRHILNFEASDFVSIVIGLAADGIASTQAWSKISREMRVVYEVSPEKFVSYLDEISKHADYASRSFVQFIANMYQRLPSDSNDARVQSVRKFMVMRAIHETDLVPEALEILYDTRIDPSSRYELANTMFAERPFSSSAFVHLVDLALKIIRAPSIPSVRTPAYSFLFSHLGVLDVDDRREIQATLVADSKKRGAEATIGWLARTLVIEDGDVVVGFDATLWNLITNSQLKAALRREIARDRAGELFLRLFVPSEWGLYASNAAKACYFVFRGR